ncbi:TPA: recombinase family protein, partial [Streptococcus agalactiae]
MNKKVKAGIYIRVSTEEQKQGHSLEAQESMLKEFADKKGYEIYDVYNDGGYSGKNFNRPEIQRLLRDLKDDKIDVILVWKVDRLSRNNTDVMSLIDTELTPR